MSKLVRTVTIAGILALAAASQAQAQGFPPLPPPTPAFEGQTGAPAPKAASAFNVETISDRFAFPWSFAFLPDGGILVVERHGTMRIIGKDRVISGPIAGVPPVKTIGAQSLHDVALDPDFAKNRLIYFTYFATPPGEDPALWPSSFFYERVFAMPLAERRKLNLGSERLARARLSADGKRLENFKVLLEGGERRVAFAPDGTLYTTGADRFRFYDTDLDGPDTGDVNLQDRRRFSGRVTRINPDGSIPRDNPFADGKDAPAETFSFGHRDPEGAAINPATGELWTVEHGPRGGDELNVIRAGRDYGWPVISYGKQYDAKPVGSGLNAMAGMEQPLYYWFPSIAPSGMMFYTGELFPEWKGNLFVGAMAVRRLIRLVLDGTKVVAEERLLADRDTRIRDVRQAPDGSVYVLTDGGALLRLTPKT